MKIKDILLEYDRTITAKKFGSKLIYQWENGLDWRSYNKLFAKWENYVDDEHPELTHKEREKYLEQLATEYLLKKLEESDPTPNKKYVPWIAREYGLGNIQMLEDLPMMRSYLDLFEKSKNKNDFKDYIKKKTDYLVNVQGNQKLKDMTYEKFKNIYNLTAKIFSFYMTNYQPTVELKDKGNSETVYEDDDIRVIVPNDEQAACYYGQGTQWCTASTRTENRFDHYNRMGPLYIILPKNPKYNGEKYQLHFESNQFMDETDTSKSLLEFLANHEQFKDWLSKQENIKNKDYFVFAFNKENVMGVWKLLCKALVQSSKNDIPPRIAKMRLEYGTELSKLTFSDIMKLLQHYQPRDWDKFITVMTTLFRSIFIHKLGDVKLASEIFGTIILVNSEYDPVGMGYKSVGKVDKYNVVYIPLKSKT